MAKDAESHAAEDRGQRDQIEARNRADAMVYNVEKTLKEHRSKISDAEAREIEAAIEETKKAMGENDPAKLNAATDKLTQASHKLAEAMYKAASPGATGAAGAGGSGANGAAGDEPGQSKPKDDVVDAEFVDVDPKDKK